MGRPSNYDEKLAAQVCERLSAGEPLTAICKSEGMPGRSTVCDWRRAHPEFQTSYAQAREASGDVWAERALQAALSSTPETAQASRLKFDGLRWFAAKMAPRTYGDKMQHVGDGGGAVEVRITIDDAAARDDDFQATADDSDARAES